MKLEHVESALFKLLESGRYGSDGRLPPERELCKQLGVSRGTLRKALEILEAKGKIWRHVGRGTFVGSRQIGPKPSLVAITEATSPSELMELRLILEPQIARLAAIRASPSEIAYMLYCVERSEAAGDSKTYELWDGTLHHAIAKASHNALILHVFEAVNELRNLTAWGQLRDEIVSPRERLLYWCRQHRQLVERIADRDPTQAEHIARLHVEEVFKSMTAVARTRAHLEPVSSLSQHS